MTETERLETYLLTHAKCATREARSAFTRHLILFVTAVVLFKGDLPKS